MELDFNTLVFPGKHQPIFAPNGAVATSQPLAAQAGTTDEILQAYPDLESADIPAALHFAAND